MTKKSSKIFNLHVNGELVQTGAYLAGMAEALGSNHTEGNILLLVFS